MKTNIFFTTSSDGLKTEGIGAVVQYQIICYILSKIYDTQFYFTGFKNLHHYQYFDTTQEKWDQEINDFFNFKTSSFLTHDVININNDSLLSNSLEIKETVILNFEGAYLMRTMYKIIDKIKTREVLLELKNNLKLKQEQKYFKNNKKNIAIHIRKFTKTDNCTITNREYFTEARKNIYLNYIEQLDNENHMFHIYSQGTEEEFEFLKKENVILHIEENPLISLYHMINADFLITANSSFSYIAHLLGTHEKCFGRSNFWHKWKKETKLI
jgi:hypothetical protein